MYNTYAFYKVKRRLLNYVNSKYFIAVQYNHHIIWYLQYIISCPWLIKLTLQSLRIAFVIQQLYKREFYLQHLRLLKKPRSKINRVPDTSGQDKERTITEIFFAIIPLKIVQLISDLNDLKYINTRLIHDVADIKRCRVENHYVLFDF